MDFSDFLNESTIILPLYNYERFSTYSSSTYLSFCTASPSSFSSYAPPPSSSAPPPLPPSLPPPLHLSILLHRLLPLSSSLSFCTSFSSSSSPPVYLSALLPLPSSPPPLPLYPSVPSPPPPLHLVILQHPPLSALLSFCTSALPDSSQYCSRSRHCCGLDCFVSFSYI